MFKEYTDSLSTGEVPRFQEAGHISDRCISLRRSRGLVLKTRKLRVPLTFAVDSLIKQTKLRALEERRALRRYGQSATCYLYL